MPRSKIITGLKQAVRHARRKTVERQYLERECSFCGKPRSQVLEIIAGAGAFICNECTWAASDILDELGVKRDRAVEQQARDA